MCENVSKDDKAKCTNPSCDLDNYEYLPVLDACIQAQVKSKYDIQRSIYIWKLAL